jgi:hypothetical protein
MRDQAKTFVSGSADTDNENDQKFLIKEEGYMEARVGFEPTNGGFADLSLGPLGYRAQCARQYIQK